MPPSVRRAEARALTLARSHALSDQEWPLNACFLACLLSWIGTRMDGSRTTSRWFRRRMICVCRPSESWTGRITPSTSTEGGRPTLHSSRVAARPRPPHSRSASVGSSRFPSSISSPLADTFLSILPSSSSLGVGFGRALVPVSPSPGPTHALTRHLLHATTSFDYMQLFPRWRNDDNDDTSNVQQDPTSNVSQPELPNGSQRIKRGAGACLSLSAAQMSE